MTDEEESKEEQNPMSTPANSYLPSESSRIRSGFDTSFDDVVMAELQPQAISNHLHASPQVQVLNKWYAEGGVTYLSFTK